MGTAAQKQLYNGFGRRATAAGVSTTQRATRTALRCPPASACWHARAVCKTLGTSVCKLCRLCQLPENRRGGRRREEDVLTVCGLWCCVDAVCAACVDCRCRCRPACCLPWRSRHLSAAPIVRRSNPRWPFHEVEDDGVVHVRRVGVAKDLIVGSNHESHITQGHAKGVVAILHGFGEHQGRCGGLRRRGWITPSGLSTLSSC